jgi:peptide chain release factor subunit 1
MAGTVSWDTLRELAGLEVANGCAISLYLNLDPRETVNPGGVQTRLNSLLDAASRSEWARGRDQRHEVRLGVRADLDRIRRYVELELVRDGAHGVALFSASLDGIWRALELVEPVPDEVHVDRRLALAPLAVLAGRSAGAIVVVAGREAGRFYALRAGRLVEITDLSSDQPGRHDQGGWSQARFQRHIDELAAGHLRAVAEEIDRRVRRASGRLDVVIVAPEESRAELAGHLTQEVEHALAGWTHAEAHASPSELESVVAPVLAERRGARERELVERWREGTRSGRSTAGWGPTLDAVSDARVETLLADPAGERPVWRCPSCGRASASAGACPLDGDQMEDVADGLDVAVGLALRSGGTVWIAEGPDLGPGEGIGALLRY